jgi:hypothetical protein
VTPATGTQLVIDNVDPALLVSANRRIHHHQRWKITAHWRGLAADVVHAEYGHAEEGESWYPTAHITLHIRFPDRRRHDIGNLYPYVAKPIIDGLVDARLIPDDDDQHLVGPDMRRDPERGPHRRARITIHIREGLT